MNNNPDPQQSARKHRAARQKRLTELCWRELSDDGCPLRLVGRQCLNDRDGYEYGDCWCCSRLNDPSATYTDRPGHRFVLWEPYGADGDALAEVIAQARTAGLRVTITSSVWNPPSTIGIRFAEVTR